MDSASSAETFTQVNIIKEPWIKNCIKLATKEIVGDYVLTIFSSATVSNIASLQITHIITF
jgi:hypothetical protein